LRNCSCQAAWSWALDADWRVGSFEYAVDGFGDDGGALAVLEFDDGADDDLNTAGGQRFEGLE